MVLQFPTTLVRLKNAKIKHDKDRQDTRNFYFVKRAARLAANPDISLEQVCIKHNINWVNRFDEITGERFDCCPTCEQNYFDDFEMLVEFDDDPA